MGIWMITQGELKEILRYDPESGEFYWAKPGRKRVMSRPAGNLAPNGYRYIRVSGKLVCAHRLAFLYMTGEMPDGSVDHINGDRADNRWMNLRLASRSENACNSRLSSRNTSGKKGVSWYAPGAKWRATIQKNGKCHSLGYFDTVDQAEAARISAAEKLHGEFARAS